MKTNFSPDQLKDSGIKRANQILRSCVHCGFCTATCPTYQLLGDELDSPRGRIYLIKDMLENDRPADEKTVKHIDRCLSCLACMSTCPSGVHYMHLVDLAREHIEKTYKRPWLDRTMRFVLANILPYPKRFRLSIMGAWMAKPFRFAMPKLVRAMVDFAPAKLPKPSHTDKAQTFPAKGKKIRRVALLTGCAQKALNTDINEATIRLLTRFGCEVVIAKGMGCCGAVTHHMGKTDASHKSAAANISAWIEADVDTVVINTSGCGTTVKDYGHMFRDDPLAEDAKKIAAMTKDISELMEELGVSGKMERFQDKWTPVIRPETRKNKNLEPGFDTIKTENAPDLKVAYHAACSLQHGQQIKEAPKNLLRAAGFAVLEPTDPHLCCGSAGTYNLMQPELASQLGARKTATLEKLKPDVIAAGNIGCMMQIGAGTQVPIVHTVELLDWATGGPKPAALGE
ncbi:MAG TPA: glycolate oxidase subunit GlcF [Devosia sp.]|nr:glycolate oxidase subunit GlcF [Devosia sp.]